MSLRLPTKVSVRVVIVRLVYVALSRQSFPAQPRPKATRVRGTRGAGERIRAFFVTLWVQSKKTAQYSLYEYSKNLEIVPTIRAPLCDHMELLGDDCQVGKARFWSIRIVSSIMIARNMYLYAWPTLGGLEQLIRVISDRRHGPPRDRYKVGHSPKVGSVLPTREGSTSTSTRPSASSSAEASCLGVRHSGSWLTHTLYLFGPS